MSEMDAHKWGDEERCLTVPNVEGYRQCDREDADDALQQAVLSCPRTSRKVFCEAMMDLVADWILDGDPSMSEDLTASIFETSMQKARRLQMETTND